LKKENEQKSEQYEIYTGFVVRVRLSLRRG